MFGVIETGGKQYKVSVGDKIKIEKVDAKQGDNVVFDKVLLLADDKGEVKLGQPYVEGAKVQAKVLEQGREKKKIVFKFKPKSNYKVKRGHRQPYTKIEIVSIS